jgi:hypothetical protein
MREDLKDQNLSFTEIAKLVGENWQNLSRSEKAPYETQAHEAKDKYNRDMLQYKKTDNFRKYSDYLQDFRKRQAAQGNVDTNSGYPATPTSSMSLINTPDSETSKRMKIQPPSLNGASVATRGSASGSESRSDSQTGSEPPPNTRRIDSAPSQAGSSTPPGLQRWDSVRSAASQGPLTNVIPSKGAEAPMEDESRSRSRTQSNSHERARSSTDHVRIA